MSTTTATTAPVVQAPGLVKRYGHATATGAAEIALARLDGDRTRARTVTVPTRLIPRGSGELPPTTR